MTSLARFPSLDDLRRRQSAKWRDHAPDVLPLPVAEADFELAEPVSRALTRAIELSDTGYASRHNDLPAAFASFAARRWGWKPDPAQVTLVPETGVGIVETLRALTEPGDRVAISQPVYQPFPEWVREVGAVPEVVPLLRDADGWSLDLAGLERAFASGVRAYVLCNPHNPVGRVHSADELRAVAELSEQHDVWVVSDEIHAPLTYPGEVFTPYLTASEAARRRGVVATSASKAWNLAGLKCALLVTQSETAAEMHRRLPGEMRWRVGHLGVLAGVAAYRDSVDWLDSAVRVLDHNRHHLRRLLGERLPEVGYHPPQAAYLAWLDAAPLGWDDHAASHLLERHRIALNAGREFGAVGTGHLRLNFACPPEVLDLAVDALAAYHRSVLEPVDAL